MVCHAVPAGSKRVPRTRRWHSLRLRPLRQSADGLLPDLDCDAPVLQHRRYDYLVRDLDYVLHISGIAATFVTQPLLLRCWLGTLRRAQGSDVQQLQVRRPTTTRPRCAEATPSGAGVILIRHPNSSS